MNDNRHIIKSYYNTPAIDRLPELKFTHPNKDIKLVAYSHHPDGHTAIVEVSERE